MKRTLLRLSGHIFMRVFRPNAGKSAEELALLQARREKRFGTHDEERFLGRDMVARWKSHRLWG